MRKIFLNPEVSGAAKNKPDPGYIGLPDQASSYDFLKTESEKFGPSIMQYATKYNFFFAPFNLSVGVNKKARGVLWFRIKGTLGSDEGQIITADDAGPKTSWISRGDKLDLEIYVDFNVVKKIFEIVDLPSPVGGKLDYKWHRESKVAKVVTELAGSKAGWTFTATEGVFVDGSHQVSLLLRVPKQVKNLFFDITEAEAYYDYSFGRDTIFYKEKPVRIPIEVP